ncbi:MAG: T9SS type A sorting domain-containing protein [Pedobacter sp.]|nr:MAG: T9SS type A sorting domain-containing protein [Pedobacter sp.]
MRMVKLYKTILLLFVIIVASLPLCAQLSGYGSTISATKIYSNYPIFSVETLLFAKRDDVNFTNYPNPATTRTTVGYTLSQKSSVNLRVIDLAGKQLAVLIKSTQATGKHEFNWEFVNNNISAGMYILVLQVDSKTYTRKVIIQ